MTIASLNNRMAIAERMPIQDVQRAVQDGTLPAYIGISIINDKMKQQQGAMQPPQQRPPVAQQVLQAANQSMAPQQPQMQPQMAQQQPQQPPQEPQGVDQLPSGIGAMAHGGIVAFADGGDVEDFDPEEYQDQLDEDEYMSNINNMLDNYSRHAGIAGISGASSRPNINHTPRVESGIVANAPDRGENPGVKPEGGITTLQDSSGLYSAASKKHGVPESLLEHMAMAESSGKSNAKNPLSSAAGTFQFTDGTWKQMGGKPGGQFNAEDNADMAGKYSRQNADYLRGHLKRDPTFGEVYAAHHFGPAGGRTIATADPQLPIEQVLASYSGQGGAEKIIAANPYLKGRTAGEVMSILNKKMGEGSVTMAQGGIVGLAHGGVAHFRDTGAVYDPMGNVTMPAQGYEPEKPPEYGLDVSLGRLFNKDYQPFDKKKWQEELTRTNSQNLASQGDVRAFENAQAEKASAARKASTDASESSDDAVRLMTSREPVTGRPPAPPATVDDGLGNNPTADRFDAYLKRLEGQDHDLKKQREIDNYMALLMAGLGAAGGTSPNALSNISQGAMAGIASKQGADKSRAAEQAAVNRGMLGAYRYQGMEDTARENRKAIAGQRADSLALQQQVADDRAEGRRDTLAQKSKTDEWQEMQRLTGAASQIEKNIAAQYAGRLGPTDDPNFEKAKARDLAAHRGYNAIQRRLYPEAFEDGAVAPPTAGTPGWKFIGPK